MEEEMNWEEYDPYFFAQNVARREAFKEYRYSPEEEMGEFSTTMDSSDYGRITRTTTAAPVISGLFIRDPINSSLMRFRAVLESSYSFFPESRKEDAYGVVSSLPWKLMITLNTEILVPAVIFHLEGDDAKSFIKKARGLKNVNHLDFIRYVRLLDRTLSHSQKTLT